MNVTDRENTPIYQMRAYLFYLKPIVWRRFLVRRDASIEHLHQVICCLFDFNPGYPYQFRAGKVHFSVGIEKESYLTALIEDWKQDTITEMVDEKTVPIDSMVEQVKGQKSPYKRNIFFDYQAPDRIKITETDEEIIFDLRDQRTVNWTTVISCEKGLPLENGRYYPCCITGERASPPSCFSGEHDYSTFLNNRKRLGESAMIQGLKIRYGKRATESVKLIENGFDPVTFDLKNTNQCIGRITQS